MNEPELVLTCEDSAAQKPPNSANMNMSMMNPSMMAPFYSGANIEEFIWTPAKIEKFIELIEARPCIYAPSSSDYYDRHKKRVSVAEICQEMEITEDIFNSKWMSLRAQYRRERLRILKSMQNGAEGDEIYRTKWIHYQKLNFLDEFTSNKPSSTTVKKKKKSSTVSYESSEGEDDDDYGMDSVGFVVSNEGMDSIIGESQSRKTTLRPSSLRKRKNIKLEPDDSQDPNYSDVSQPQVESTWSVSQESSGTRTCMHSANESENELFGRFVVSELNKIKSEEHRRYAKLKIHCILFEAQSQSKSCESSDSGGRNKLTSSHLHKGLSEMFPNLSEQNMFILSDGFRKQTMEDKQKERDMEQRKE